MARVLKLQEKDRIETGSVKFIYSDGYEDWNGMFIRGDNCLHIRMLLRSIEHCLIDEDTTKESIAFHFNQLKSYFDDTDVIQN
jgi:hypothetical protein